MAAMRFKPAELFGGAMTAEIPEGFGDVRYVPTALLPGLNPCFPHYTWSFWNRELHVTLTNLYFLFWFVIFGG